MPKPYNIGFGPLNGAREKCVLASIQSGRSPMHVEDSVGHLRQSKTSSLSFNNNASTSAGAMSRRFACKCFADMNSERRSKYQSCEHRTPGQYIIVAYSLRINEKE